METQLTLCRSCNLFEADVDVIVFFDHIELPLKQLLHRHVHEQILVLNRGKYNAIILDRPISFKT